MATNGNSILVYSGSTLIAGLKSNSAQTDTDLQEKASATSGKWKSYLTYRNSGSISVGYLVMADTSALGVSGGNGVKDLLQAGNEYTLVFKKRNAGNSAGVQGTYILKTVRIDAQFGNLVQGAFHFVLNGALAAGSD